MAKQPRRTRPPRDDEQFARFVQAAKEAGADMSTEEFKAALRRADLKRKPESRKPEAKKPGQ